MPTGIVEVATHQPVTCQPTDTIEMAARTMAERSVGCLVAIDADERPIGIVTDRDLVVRAMAKALPVTTPIGEIMTMHPVTIRQSATLLEAARAMQEASCSRLPVVSDTYGHLIGLLSADDLLRLDAAEVDAIAQGSHLQPPTVRSRSWVD